jgi:arylsulfatase A-like enzyme
MPKAPFFLAVGFALPHVPLYATQKWFDLYPEDEVILPRMLLDDRRDTPRFSWYLHWKLPEPRQKFLLQEGEQIKIVQAYLASVSFVDSQVGRVLEALERNGLADDTIVVLWSDHGYHLGEKQITGKNTLWDRSTRVPLIFAGPGVKQGQRSGRATELLDMYPTLSELCGLEIPDHLEGLSLVPQLKDANAPRSRPAITTHNHDNHAVRTERWRYIRYADGSEELYDMVNDPNEFTNLAADSRYTGDKLALRKQLPKINRKAAPGSARRILIYKNGVANWEGEDIDPNEAIPD